MSDLVVRTVPGDHLARHGWTVYTTWQASTALPSTETSETHPDWNSARRQALSLACCRGARYVQIQSPDDVVRGEWDRYTNRWREYHHPGRAEATP